jgi:Swiss Army Knife RNA repair-like protein
VTLSCGHPSGQAGEQKGRGLKVTLANFETGEHMKVIFLDFDGPIIPARAFAINRAMSYKIPCRTSGSLVNELLKRADAKLVVSSTWRKSGIEACKEVLRLAGIDLTRLHEDWRTEDLWPLKRKDEIEKWLGAHDNIQEWIAIDDMPMDLEPDNMVWCTSHDGVLFDHYMEACKKLRIKPWDGCPDDYTPVAQR